MFKYFISILLVFCYLIDVSATHIVGGDMAYRCLGNNDYEITLTLRRDCINGSQQAPFDDPANVGIFDAQGLLLTTLGTSGVLRMNYNNNDTLDEFMFKNCGLIGGDVCVHTTKYRDTIKLPFRTGGYILAYQRCCRNFTITNIINPLGTGATYSLEIKEEALRVCNSSLVLSSYPPIYICGDYPIDFNLKAYDAEGDSLVYKLCTPFEGADSINPRPTRPSSPPFVEVVFKPPFSLLDMIGGKPALQMNPMTGRMTGFAEPIIAQYLIAYCVEEYRKGVLLSVIRRDFQINVRLCKSLPEAHFDASTDPCDLNQLLKLTDLSKDNYSSIVSWNWKIVLNGNVYNSTDRNPFIQINDTGIATIRLIVQSKESCRDTIQKTIPISWLLAKVPTKNHEICKGDSVLLTNFSSTGAIYMWRPTVGLSCSTCPNPVARPISNTQYILTSTYGNCNKTDTVNIKVTSCFVDSCAIQIKKVCLPSGMVEVRILDAFGNLIQSAKRLHELFWDIKESSQHAKYILQNKNPVLLFPSDIFSITSKIYTWPKGVPKSIEYAKICERRIIDTINVKCEGPCTEMKFILSSCLDDYDVKNNLNFPPALCESVCGGSCNIIVALFEENGTLIDPNAYQILWSNGSTNSYVHIMAPYYNTLTVEVRKGECIWRGRYWKSCDLYKGSNLIDSRDFGNIFLQAESMNVETFLQEASIKNYKIYNIEGKCVAKDILEWNLLTSGLYVFFVEINGEVEVYKVWK